MTDEQKGQQSEKVTGSTDPNPNTSSTFSQNPPVEKRSTVEGGEKQGK